MKIRNKLKGMVGFWALLMISSCTLHTGKSYLANRIYVNEETLDRIEFTRKGKVFFTWTSDMCNYWRKDRSYEFYYSTRIYNDEDNNQVIKNEGLWAVQGCPREDLCISCSRCYGIEDEIKDFINNLEVGVAP